MRRRHYRIRRWLVLALAAGSLAAPAAAQAMPVSDDGPLTKGSPVSVPVVSDGFDWGDAGIGAGTVFALVAGCAGILLAATRHRRRPAAL